MLAVRDYSETHRVRILNNFIAEEDSDNRRFARDVEAWLGVEIEQVVNPKYPSGSAVEVWDDRKAMSFIHGAPCTTVLKKEARQIWEAENEVEWHVFGFTLDERHRHNNFVRSERSNVLPLLIDAGHTKSDCAAILLNHGIELPRIYREGYPNANCIGCVKATSPTYWNLVRETRPEVFAERAEQSRRLGARLVRVENERIFLDELDRDAMGQSLDTLDMPECGFFCAAERFAQSPQGEKP
jgi:hypothetical protein